MKTIREQVKAILDDLMEMPSANVGVQQFLIEVRDDISHVIPATAVAIEGDDLRFLLEWARRGIQYPESYEGAKLARIAAKYSEVDRG